MCLSLLRESELLYDWRFTANQFVLATSTFRLTTGISWLDTCFQSPYVTSSLTTRWVCRLQLLLALASAVILRSESRGSLDHILLSHIRDFPNLEGQVPVFISPRNRVAQLHPRHWVPFPSPPVTRRATVEVFDPASIREFLSPLYYQSSLYIPVTSRTGNISSITACFLAAGETRRPQNCFLATAVILWPVFTAVTWQWVDISKYIVL
jgi:hypothetical protein